MNNPSTSRFRENHESHPRQWVDSSSSTYKERACADAPESHPRQWVDSSSSTYKRRRRRSLFPLSQRAGERVGGEAFSASKTELEQSTNFVGGIWDVAAALCRLSMNNPPTAVGGIWGQRTGSLRRLSMNNPPTSLVGFGTRFCRTLILNASSSSEGV